MREPRTRPVVRLALPAALAALTLFVAGCALLTVDSDQEVSTQGTDAGPAIDVPDDPLELLRSAIETSASPSVRGQMLIEVGGTLSIATEFEHDGDQNLALVAAIGSPEDADASALSLEFRFVNGAGFARYSLPESALGALGLDGWYTIDAQEFAQLGLVCPSPTARSDEQGGLCGQPNDTRYLLELIRSAEIAGTETIDGLAVIHVQAVIDPPTGSASLFDPSMLEMFPDGIALSAWIDADGLIRRMSLDLAEQMEQADDAGPSASPSDGESGGESDDETFDGDVSLGEMLAVRIVIDFDEYGADISIAAPTPDEIVGDFGDLSGGDIDSGGTELGEPEADL